VHSWRTQVVDQWYGEQPVTTFTNDAAMMALAAAIAGVPEPVIPDDGIIWVGGMPAKRSQMEVAA
jgi:hypothetical protein